MKWWHYIVALWRALETYDSDMGGFACKLAWERGFIAAERGLPVQSNPYPYRQRGATWRAWDHGHHCGKLAKDGRGIA